MELGFAAYRMGKGVGRAPNDHESSFEAAGGMHGLLHPSFFSGEVSFPVAERSLIASVRGFSLLVCGRVRSAFHVTQNDAKHFALRVNVMDGLASTRDEVEASERTIGMYSLLSGGVAGYPSHILSKYTSTHNIEIDVGVYIDGLAVSWARHSWKPLSCRGKSNRTG